MGDVQVVHVTGRIDSSNADIFGRDIGEVIADGNRQILLDLAGVTYINSAGLRAILVVAKSLKKPGDRCVICGLIGEVREIFELAGFTMILQMYPTVNDAIVRW
ncbi:MAG: STAS domain-containing protein [Methanolinea sp.]|jgi:anti-anti-sigma factor|nr:STAS domain-containing protein [Methanolinea sp.]